MTLHSFPPKKREIELRSLFKLRLNLIILISFLFLNSFKAFSAYDASGTGAWESSSVWSTVPNDATLSGTISWYAISVSGYITRTGNLSVGNNLTVSGTLIVTGNVTGGSPITVKNGGVLIIYGNLESSGLAITVESGGTLIVLGNTTLNGGSLNVDGDFITLGNLTLSSLTTTIVNSGNIAIGGNLTTSQGQIVLSGTTAASSFYIFGDNPTVSISSNTSSAICTTAGSSCQYGDSTDMLTNDPNLYSYICGVLVQNPTSVTACTDNSVTLKIITYLTYSYQWQISTNNGSTWSSLTSSSTYSGVTSASLVISNITSTINGYKYRCILTGASTLTSNTTTLTVVSSPVITSQPASVTSCNNNTVAATFTVVTTETSLTYQWQYSTDGSTWTTPTNYPFYNYTTSTLTCASYYFNYNILVRCLITNSSGCSVYSDVATYAYTKPSAAGTITGTSKVCSGQTGVSYSVPYIAGASSYVWAYTGTGVTINGSTASITIDFSTSATSGNLSVYGKNNCGSGTTSANYAITIGSGAALSSTLTPDAICNNSVFSYTPTSSTSGATFSWSRAVVSGISNAAATGTGNINETLVNTSTSLLNVIYVYTITSGSCTNTNNVTVSVYPQIETGPIYRESNM
jgi:hypothetical protein